MNCWPRNSIIAVIDSSSGSLCLTPEFEIYTQTVENWTFTTDVYRSFPRAADHGILVRGNEPPGSMTNGRTNEHSVYFTEDLDNTVTDFETFDVLANGLRRTEGNEASIRAQIDVHKEIRREERQKRMDRLSPPVGNGMNLS